MYSWALMHQIFDHSRRNCSFPGVKPWLQICAPLFFVVVVLSRSYLEMSVFAGNNRFSYYTGLHHLCWYTSAILLIMLSAHLILHIRPFQLMVLLYGIVVVAIPLLVSWISGVPLNLEYLHGSPGEVFRQIITLSISEPRNYPLVPEVILIIIGMGFVALLLSRNWKRAIAMFFATWISLSLIGLTWFGLQGARASVFRVSSRLIRPQALQAAAWVCIATFLIALLVVLDGRCREDGRSWTISGLVALEIWIFWVVAMLISGWMPNIFDALVSGLLPATLALVLTRSLRSDRSLVSAPLRALMTLILLIQAAILAPIILHREDSLYRSREFRIRNPRQTEKSGSPGRQFH